jgi:hypothetical protein
VSLVFTWRCHRCMKRNPLRKELLLGYSCLGEQLVRQLAQRARPAVRSRPEGWPVVPLCRPARRAARPAVCQPSSEGGMVDHGLDFISGQGPGGARTTDHRRRAGRACRIHQQRSEPLHPAVDGHVQASFLYQDVTWQDVARTSVPGSERCTGRTVQGPHPDLADTITVRPGQASRPSQAADM